MPIRDLKAQIARLPEQPGVYLYYNEAGETLYVGKARVLRDRVRSYLGAQGMSPRIDALLDEAQRLEVIVTDSVVEALALENHLIKQRAPKYNILLRDDKNYPYLQLTTGEAFPRVLVARRVERDDHFYAGPFLPASLGAADDVADAQAVRDPIVQRDDYRRARPALPRVRHQAVHRAVRARAVLGGGIPGGGRSTRSCFSKGRNDELVAGLRERMTEASAAERFEQAAQLRDAIRTIETQRTRQQKMAGVELGDRDAFGLKLGPAGAVVQVFQMRGGRVIERIELVSELGETLDAGPGAAPKGDNGECDVLQAALQQFYADRPAPPEVHIPIALQRFRHRDARRLAVRRRPDAASGSSSRRAARSAACSTWRRATPRSRIRRASTRTSRRTTTRSRPCARCSRFPPCRDGSSASTFRRSKGPRPSHRWWSAKTAG